MVNQSGDSVSSAKRHVVERRAANAFIESCESCDYSGCIMRSEQRCNSAWKALAFFTKPLTLAQGKYSVYDGELLAIYSATKKFRHAVVGRPFTVYIDHKPIMYTIRQKPEKCTPRQFRYLDYISQFTADIKNISGKNNEIADAHLV